MDTEGNWAPGVEDEIEQTVRATVKRIGYEQSGFHWQTFDFANNLHPQSAHIAMASTRAATRTRARAIRGLCSATRPTRPPG